MIVAQLNQTITIGDLYTVEAIKGMQIIAFNGDLILSRDGTHWHVMNDRYVVSKSKYKFDPAWYNLLMPVAPKLRTIVGISDGNTIIS